MKDKLLLGIGGLLIILAILKPDINGFINNSNYNNPVVVVENVDSETKVLVKTIVDIIKNGPSTRRDDGKKLASLFSDIATLIEIDGEDQVISNTEEIKQANSIAGKMLKLNLKDKYPNLSNECTNYIKTVIGDDNVALDTDLRNKSVQAFRGIAWACYEGSK